MNGHGEADALRRLLDLYRRRFEALEAESPRLEARRTLTRRFFSTHARATISELERALHRRVAAGGDPSQADARMLVDLGHFRSSLRPPLSTVSRTFVVLGVALVAQLLGRLPLIPIVTGPDRKPALGSLSEAVDVDPGHVAKAIGDLVGSPLSTVCGAVATLSAAVVLILLPTLPALRRSRALVRELDEEAGSETAGQSIRTLEHEAFASVPGVAIPVRRRVDLVLSASAVICLISLGGAWYDAFARGLFRETPAYAFQTQGAPRALFRTDHPTLLGAGGLLAIFLGLALGLLLMRRTSGTLRSWIAFRTRTKRVRWSATFGSLTIAPLVLYGGVMAFEMPGLQSYDDPYLVAETVRTRPVVVAAQPIIPFAVMCRPGPCSPVKARISVGTGRLGDPLNAQQASAEATGGKSIPDLSSLQSTPVDEPALRARLGLTRVRFEGASRLPARRVTAPRTQLVQLIPESPAVPITAGREYTPTDPITADVLARYRSFLEAAPSRRARNGAIAYRMANVPAWAIVLSDADLQRLVADVTQQRVSALATLEVSVRGNDGKTRTIRIPFALRA